MNEDIYIGIKGRVVRIDQGTGQIVWETHLKRSGLTTLSIEDDLIVAHTHGELFGVRKKDGEIIWNNPLTGLGYSYCIIASKSPNSEVTIAATQAQQSAANSSGAGAG